MQFYLFEGIKRSLKNSTGGGHAPQYPVFFQKTPLFFLKNFLPFPLSPGESCAIMSPSSE